MVTFQEKLAALLMMVIFPIHFHYRGLACDIDQSKRNVTAKFLYTKEAHAIIKEHGLDDGCDFGDCGLLLVFGEIGHSGGGHYARRYAYHHFHQCHYAGA